MKRKVITATLLWALLLPMALNAQESLQVCDGTSTSTYIPMYGFYNDSRFRNEFVYPARLLGEMNGGTITQLTFYSQDNSESWNSNLVLRMAEVSDTAYSTSSAWQLPDGTDTAWTGSCTVVNGRWEIDLDNPYSYNGGHLLVSVMNTAAGSGCPFSNFYGQSLSYSAAGYVYGGSISSATTSFAPQFLPKVTFDYSTSGSICRTPAHFAASNVRPDSATLSWNSRNGESNWALYLNDTFIDVVYDSTYILDNLSANTAYTARVRAICGSGDTSNYATTSFRTACVAIAHDSLPFVEGFEAYAAGSSSASTAMSNPCWNVLNRYSTNHPFYTNLYAHTGNNSLAIFSESSTPTVVALPYFEDSPSDLMLDFWLHGQPVQVGILSNPADASTFVPILTCTPASTSEWEHFDLTFANQSSGHIAFRYAGSNYSNSYIDDITISQLPPCTRPSSVVAANVDSTSADIIISDANGTSHYMLYLSATDSVELYDTIYPMADLTPSTAYTVSVRTICNNDSMTEAVTYSFSTSCGIIFNLPWHENFDSYGSLFTSYPNEMEGEMIPCWGLIKSNTSARMSLTNSSYRYGDAGYSLVFYPGQTNRRNYIILPEFGEEISNLELQFQTRPEGASSSSGSFDVGYMTDATDSTTFVSLQHYDYSDFDGEYVQKIVTFDTAPYGARMAMRHNTAASNYYWFVDEIDVHTRPSCDMPTSIAIAEVTTTSITVGVTGDPNNIYDYRIYSNDAIVDSATSEDTSWTFDNLLPNRPYTIRVRSECYYGNYTAALSLSTRTACAAITANDLPYTEDFESYSTYINTIPCWTLSNYGSTYSSYPQTSSTTGRTGSSKALYFYSYDNVQFVALPETESLSDLQFSYFAKASGNYEVSFTVGVMTDPNDTTTFTALESVNIDNHWDYHITDLSQYGDTGRFVAIRYASNGADYHGFYLDDVDLRVAPSCARPTGLAVNHMTPYSAVLNINDTAAGNDYTVTLSSGTTTDTIHTTDTLVNFTGLTPNTTYTLSVTANCSDGYSHLPLTLQFSTPCTAVDSLPWNEGFENMALDLSNGNLPCWGYIANSQSNSKVVVVNASSRVHGGNKSLRFNGNCQNPNFAILPYFGDSIQGLKLSMWIVAENGTAPGFLRVGYLANPTDSSTFVQTASFNCADYTTYGQVEAYFAGAPAGARMAISQKNNNENYWWWVDDIVVDYAPMCSSPVIAVSNITDTSATVTLSDANNTNHYRLFTSPTDSVEVTGSTYLLTGLTPSTSYALTAKTLCTADEVSNSAATSFTTACGIITHAMLPWTEGFENFTGDSYASSTSALNDPCWTVLNRYSSNYPYITTNASYTNSGSQCLVLYGSSTPATIMVLPQFADSLANLLFTFHMLKTTSSAYGVDAGYMTDPNNASTYVSLQSCINTSTNAYEVYDINFPSNAAGRIALRYNGNYTSIYLDDFTVGIAPSCQRPNGVTVSNVTANSADITITDSTNNNNYRVIVNGTDTSTITTQSLSLTGLSPATNYTVSISSICADGDITFPVTVSFQTLCAAITSLPWSEDFNSIPSGTTNLYTGSHLPCWDMFRGRYIDSTNTVTSEAATFDIFALNNNAMGSAHLRCNLYGTDNYRWLATPTFTLSTPAEFSFRYALTKYNNGNAIDSIGYDDRFMVLVTADGGTTWTPVYTFGHGADADVQIDSVSNTPDSVSIDLTSFMGQTIRIAFYGESVESNSDNDFHIDDLRLISTSLPPTYYEVTLLTSNSAMGTVSPAGVTSIVENSAFTATATATDGYHFVGWYNGTALASTDNPYTFIVTSDLTLTGRFEQDIAYYTVNVTSADATLGTVSPYGDTLVAEGESLTVRANPSTGARFNGWYVGEELVSNGNPYTFQVNNDLAIVAAFMQQYNVTIDYNPFQGQATGGGVYDAGSEVTITATPEAGYLFNGWLFNGSADTIFANPYTFTLNENADIQAIFKQQPVGIDPVATANFTLFPNPASNVVNISGLETEATVTILDMNGREVFRATATNDNVAIDLKGYAQGTYFVRVTGKQCTSVRKLIVK